MVQTAADVTTAISAHSHDLEQAEIEEMKRYTISSSFSFYYASKKLYMSDKTLARNKGSFLLSTLESKSKIR